MGSNFVSKMKNPTQLIAKSKIGSPWLSLALPDYFSLILYLKWRIQIRKTNPMPPKPN